MTSTLLSTADVEIRDADPGDELTKLATEIGVFVAQEPDVTGGLDQLREILREKTSANPVVESVTPPPVPLWTRLRAAFTRGVQVARAFIRNVVSAVKRSLTWLVAPTVDRVTKQVYRPRHGIRRTWYGVQRSTADRVAIHRQNASRQPDDSEPALPELPEYWISHMERFIEVIQGHHDALHPRKGYQFIC